VDTLGFNSTDNEAIHHGRRDNVQSFRNFFCKLDDRNSIQKDLDRRHTSRSMNSGNKAEYISSYHVKKVRLRRRKCANTTRVPNNMQNLKIKNLKSKEKCFQLTFESVDSQLHEVMMSKKKQIIGVKVWTLTPIICFFFNKLLSPLCRVDSVNTFKFGSNALPKNKS